MKTVSKGKYEKLQQLSTDDHIISALAIDQRGSLRKMILADREVEDIDAEVSRFKELVSRELTPYASSILLDPEYGLPASKQRDSEAGLLLSYEKTGYDATEAGRLPDLIENQSPMRIAEEGGDAVKFLLYYDPDEGDEINDRKKAFTERIGLECVAQEIPFFMELVSYDAKINADKSKEYAKVRPQKVIDTMKVFSDPRFNVDVLKVEIPVNLNYVEGFAENEEDVVYTREEAIEFFKQQDAATDLPFIFLSGGVSTEMFQEGIRLAKEANSSFNGVLCGRATWKGAVSVFVEQGEEAAVEWLRTTGKENIVGLNAVVAETANSWDDKIQQA